MDTTRLYRYLTALLLLCATCPAVAQAAGPDTSGAPAWGFMTINLLGGLALFLLGMDMMASLLRRAAGDRMKSILGKLTATPIAGAITGAVVTAVIQSSSVTTVLVVGFVTANLMSLSQAVGVIMGANIGSTITAQIIAFNVSKWALLLVALGFALQFFVKREWLKDYGGIVLGLGLVFFGMSVMSQAMNPLRSFTPFLDLMSHMDNVLLAILVGTAFTALIQSSAATTGIVIVLASSGFISLNAGIALVLGANIGTCVTALLAAIGKPRTAVQAAVVHVLFNVFGVLLWVAFVDQLAQWVVHLSPVTGQTSDTPRQIANAHTIFNVVNTLLFLGFSEHFARLARFLVPERPDASIVVRPKHLDDLLLQTPSLALDAVRRELQRIGNRVAHMMEASLPAVLSGNAQQLRLVADMDNKVDILHGHVIRFLGEISKQNLSDQQTNEFIRLMEAANDLENVGDVIETNLVDLGYKRIAEGVNVSPRTREILTALHTTVTDMLASAVEAVTEQDVEKARHVIGMKTHVNTEMANALKHEAKRLIAQEPGRVSAYSIEVDIVEKLKRIYYYAKRMAKVTLPVGETEESVEIAENAAAAALVDDEPTAEST